jgi:hypothetical protein
MAKAHRTAILAWRGGPRYENNEVGIMTQSKKEPQLPKTEPRLPGLYWYRKSPKHPLEVVKLAPDGHVWFIGDWRAQPITDLEQAVWGERLVAPDSEHRSTA